MRFSRLIFSLLVVFLFITTVFAEVSEIGTFRVQGYYLDVEVSGDYVYVPTYNNGLYVGDISDPSNPVQVGHTGTVDDRFRSITIRDYYLYAAGYRDGFSVYDISDPTTPTLVHNIRPDSTIYDVVVEGDYAYVASYWYGLYIFNISDPANAYTVSHLDTPGAEYCVRVENGIVVIASYSYGLVVIDATDPENPIIQDTITGDRWVHTYALDIQDGIAYINERYNGLRIVDFSDPCNLVELGSLDEYPYFYQVTVEGDYVYMSHTHMGLRIFDISDPANPTLVETIDTPFRAYNCTIQDSYLYLCDYRWYVRIYGVVDYVDHPEIEVNHKAIDFGLIEFRRTAMETLTVSNVGNSDLTVSDISVSGDFYFVDFNGEFVLAEGESRDVTVTNIPEQVGENLGEIVISSDDAATPELIVDLRGDCVWVPIIVLLRRLIVVCEDLDINGGRINSLVVKLEHTITKYLRGQVRSGTNMLNSYINHAEGFRDGGVVSPDDGDYLVSEGYFIMGLVNEFGVCAPGDGLVLANPIPDDFYFDNCYPNPFNAETTISFGLPGATFVSIQVYDMSGRVVVDLASGQYSPARYELSWYAEDMAAGNYLIQLNAGEFNAIRKVALIK